MKRPAPAQKKTQHQPRLWFILRREPYYHKIQYSKAPKFDTAAAVFGVIVGAFVVFLTLASVGSGGADLTDLTCLMWYAFLCYYIIKTWVALQKTTADLGCAGLTVLAVATLELLNLALNLFRPTPRRRAKFSKLSSKGSK